METPVKVKKTKIIGSKRRGRKREELTSKKMIMEQEHKFRIQFPVENDTVYAPEIMAIVGARFDMKIPYNPGGKLSEDQISTFLNVYTIPKSEENMQIIARFGKSHRFDFDSDIAVRAHVGSAEGKALERMSYARSSSIKIPKLGGKLLKFQPAAVEYALRAKRTFIADEMGLGKTVEALAAMSTDNSYPWLIVCPANLKLNWHKEARLWLKTRKINGKRIKVTILTNKLLTLTPSKKISSATKKLLKEPQVFICNYDRVEKYIEFLKTVNWRGIIFDESHYLKANYSRRSRACQSLCDTVEPEYIFCLSGTPLMNRPDDIVSQLRILGRLNDFGGFNTFVKRYCGLVATDPAALRKVAQQERRRLALENGTITQEEEETIEVEDPLAKQSINDAIVRKVYANMVDLNKQLRSTCYIRREKTEVLKDLPAKTRSTLPLEITNRKLYQKIEEDVCNYLADLAVKDENFLKSIAKLSLKRQQEALTERRSTKYFKSARAEALVRLGALKLCAATGKMKAAVEWINDFLENGTKLVVFAHHHVIIDELIDAFPEAVHTKGSMEARHAAVEKFQNDPKCRLFIGSLKRDGVGLTLTASQSTAFLELGWTPAAHDQAEDRVHRIGQKGAVTAYYLLAKNTVEERIAALIEAKRKVVNAVADGDPLHNIQQGTIFGSILQELSGAGHALTLAEKPIAAKQKKGRTKKVIKSKK